MIAQSGSFTGNGATGRAITGLGFQPDLVLVKNINAGNDTWFRTKDMPAGDYSMPIRSDAGSGTNCIQSLDVDGFTVGNATVVNGSSNSIMWLAVKDTGAGDFATISYTGNGNDDYLVFSSFQPDYSLIKSTGNIVGAEKFAGQGSALANGSSNLASMNFQGGGDRQDLMAFLPGGLYVSNGSGSGGNLVNQSGTAHYGFAFKNNGTSVLAGSYTGNGTSNRILTTGFTPIFVTTHRSDGNNPFSSFKDEAVMGYMQAWDQNAQTGLLNANGFLSTGYQLASESGFGLNVNAQTFWYFALGVGSGNGTTVKPQQGNVNIYSTAVTRTNYAPNPRMVNSGYMTTYGSATSTFPATDKTINGTTTSLKVTGGTAGADFVDGGVFYQFTLAAGVYYISTDVISQANGSGGGIQNVHLVVRGQDTTVYTQQHTSTDSPTPYKMGFTFTNPTTQTINVLMGLGSYGSSSQGTAWFTNLLIESGSTQNPFFDGNSTSSAQYTYSWTGTANASSSTETYVSITSTTKTQVGNVRIAGTTTANQLGNVRVRTTVLKTILGNTRITKSVPRTQLGNFRIFGTTLKTITGNTRITVTNTKNILGNVNIAPSSITTTQNQSGNVRIGLVSTQNIIGTIRISVTNNQNQNGNLRISLVNNKDTTGNFRITSSTNKDTLGNFRVQSTSTQVQNGNVRVGLVSTQNISGNTRIALLSNQIISGNVRITSSTTRNQLGAFRIGTSSSQNIVGNVRIISVVPKAQLGNFRITASTNQNQVGNIRTQVTNTQNILGNTRIAVVNSKDQIGNTRVTTYNQKAQAGNFRVTGTTAQIITGNITVTFNQTVTRNQVGSYSIIAGLRFYTDFSEYVVGQTPNDWSLQWNGSTNWYVATDGAVKYLENTNGVKDDHPIYWNTVGSQSDVDLLVKMRTTDPYGYQNHVYARGGGAKNTYYVAMYDNRTNFRGILLDKWVGSSYASLGGYSYGYQPNTWYWVRFRLTGTNLQARIWQDGTQEPFGTWHVNVADGSLGSGSVGFSVYDTNGTRNFGVMSVATGGQSASMRTPQSQSGNVRINSVTTKDIVGNVRIQKTSSVDQVGNFRIQKATTLNQLGNVRIQSTSTKTIIGSVWITKVWTQDQIGRFWVGSPPASANQLGNVRVTAQTQRVQLGNIRISNTVQRTQIGNVRIGLVTVRNQLGSVAILATSVKNQLGNFRIQGSTNRDQLGNVRIRQTVVKSITGQFLVAKSVNQDIIGTVRIEVATSRDISGNVTVIQFAYRDQSGNFRIYDRNTLPAGFPDTGTYIPTGPVEGGIVGADQLSGGVYLPTGAVTGTFNSSNIDEEGIYKV